MGDKPASFVISNARSEFFLAFMVQPYFSVVKHRLWLPSRWEPVAMNSAWMG